MSLPAATFVRPSPRSRLFGLGSVFAKSLRDSWLSVAGVGAMLGVLTFVTAVAVAEQFRTPADRAAIVAQMELLPAMFRGLLGEPINIGTLPGFLSWRVVGFMPVMLGLWSIGALSATLAGEAARGTMEILLATPVSRRAVAVQKYAAHALGVFVAMFVVAVLAWLATRIFASLPGDEADLAAVLAEFGLVGLIGLLAGSIAFAVAPLVGRTVAAGLGALYLFGSYVVNGYAEFVPGFDVLRNGSVFHWTSGHRPMAGTYDWPAVALVAALTVVLAVVGVALFVRRDLAATVSVGGRLGRLVRARPFARASVGRWSLAGPGLRSFGERLPSALVWGGLLGLYGFVLAVSAEQFAETLTAVPQIMQMINQIFPDLDFTQAGAILQFALFGFVALAAGIAASTLVGGWASDEREGRLEVVLSGPLRRVAWFLRSGGAVLIAIVSIGVVVGLLTGTGAAIGGSPALPVFAGGVIIGLYAAALGGVGLLVAGLGRPAWAGAAVVGATLTFYLLDLIGSILRLPEWVQNLSLVRHLGQPMAGSYDVPGMIACVALAAGGLVLGAAAFARRDLR